MAKRRLNGDGMVRKRKDGRWEGRIIVGNKSDGKPIYRSVFAKTQKELLVSFNKLKAFYEDMHLTDESCITLSDWLDKWIEEYKRPIIRDSTVKSYYNYANHYIKPYLGSKRLTQLTTESIQRMYNTLKKSGRVIPNETKGSTLSNAMVRGVHMMLHEALDSAVGEGLIPINPTEGTTIPKLEKKPKPVLLEEQIEQFMKVIEDDPMWHDFFYTELMTGLRRGEICGLQWKDFDEEAGTLHVQRTIKFLNNSLMVGETKTNEGNRKFVLPKSVADMLKERKKTCYTEWVFPQQYKPELPVNPATAYHALKRILTEAGLPDMRFHDLRHTFATHAASSGIDPRTLSGILGHTKASFTLDTYTHVTTDMQKQAAKVVGNYLTDIFGEELKPWEDEEKTVMEL